MRATISFTTLLVCVVGLCDAGTLHFIHCPVDGGDIMTETHCTVTDTKHKDFSFSSGYLLGSNDNMQPPVFRLFGDKDGLRVIGLNRPDFALEKGHWYHYKTKLPKGRVVEYRVAAFEPRYIRPKEAIRTDADDSDFGAASPNLYEVFIGVINRIPIVDGLWGWDTLSPPEEHRPNYVFMEVSQLNKKLAESGMATISIHQSKSRPEAVEWVVFPHTTRIEAPKAESKHEMDMHNSDGSFNVNKFTRLPISLHRHFVGEPLAAIWQHKHLSTLVQKCVEADKPLLDVLTSLYGFREKFVLNSMLFLRNFESSKISLNSASDTGFSIGAGFFGGKRVQLQVPGAPEGPAQGAHAPAASQHPALQAPHAQGAHAPAASLHPAPLVPQ